jgi:endo-1,3-1,4-beta-glycanase ExoK
LLLSASPEGPKEYSGGEIGTHERFVYGYFEARLRVARGEGLVTALFSYARDDGRRSWREIDMEIAGRDTRRLELAYHVAGRARKHVVDLPSDAAADFHTYGFAWTPEAIRWYVDNELVHEARGRGVAAMTTPQRFMINLWNSRRLRRWVGDIDSAKAPWRATLACAAVAPHYEGRSLCAE